MTHESGLKTRRPRARGAWKPATLSEAQEVGRELLSSVRLTEAEREAVRRLLVASERDSNPPTRLVEPHGDEPRSPSE